MNREVWLTVETLAVAGERGTVEDWMMRALGLRMPFRVEWIGAAVAQFSVPRSWHERAVRLWRECRNA